MAKVQSRDAAARDVDRGRTEMKVAMEEYARVLASDQSTTFFDMAKAPGGMEYIWARETVRGQPDEGRVPQLCTHKFTGVPFSRHLDLYGEHMRYRQASPDDSVRVQGQMLMERPKVLGDMQRSHMQKNMLLQQRQAARHVTYAGDDLTPARTFRNETSMMSTRMGTEGAPAPEATELDW